MDPGEMTTGTRDEHYNLVSVLYHALQGAETAEAYILDAEAAGDERLAAFFREAQTMQGELAERAKELLGILEVPPEPGVAPDVPLEGGVTPGSTPAQQVDAPPRSAEEAGVPGEETPGEPGRAVPERRADGERG